MKRFFCSNKALLVFFVFFGLFFTFQHANADLFGISDFPDMAMNALDFIDKAIASLFYLLIAALGSAVFIMFSAQLLDWTSALPVGLTDNALVNAGWGFLSGFVNIIFILIFIVIALSYILKLETFGMKKALPRLIIVAFLLNFSLLFVKMFVDVGWLAQNSFKLAFFEDGHLALPIATQVGTALLDVVGKYFLSFFVPYFVAAFIPFANTAAQIAFATIVVGTGVITGEIFMGTFSQAIMLVAFGLIGGLIFFLYALFFFVRIAVIWLLAIVAPLAFAAWILPQTQKFFGQWLKTLFQWTFLGVVVFFLMGLGLKLFAGLATGGSVAALGFNFTVYYSRFLFLLIYLVVCFFAAKKFTPAGTEAIWSALERGAKAAGKVASGTAWKTSLGSAKIARKSIVAYREARQAGFSVRDAFEEVGREIRKGIRPTRPGGREATWKEAAATAATGIWKAVRDVNVAGFRATFKMKTKKKKGKEGKPEKQVPCPTCGQMLAESAVACTRCGARFEAEPEFGSESKSK
jgi:hypothetical protein